jgi:ABC-type branched-subunit amino acid transport system substrate-binding protein
LKFALALSMTGPGSFYGVPAADGARLAVEEANAAPGAAPITFDILDDESSPQKAAEIAGRLAESDVPVVVGPSLTVAAMLAGPVYGRAGLASIVATSHGDDVVAAPTIFQPIFNTGEMGMSLANYLLHVLGQQRAVVLYRDDAYGRPLAAGFRQAAERLGMDGVYLGFTDDAGRDAAARMALAEPGHPAVALGMLAPDAVPLIKQLRRAGAASTILGPSAISGDDFANLFAAEPEEQAKPGFFTNNLYAASPMLFDSADAETIAFASRFRSRFGREPDWQSIQGYDATRLAVAALRDMASAVGVSGDRTIRREAVRHFLLSLDGPDHAVAGVTGPLWFKPDRGRAQPVRIGRFQDRMFESAPMQLVPISGFDDSEMESGAVIALGHGRYARRQLVVFTGLLLNEMARLDIAQSRLSADIYLWMRYPEPRGGATADPDDIAFPDLLRGSSDGMQLERSAILADGTRYRLWRLHGDFRNEFDLRRFPVDRQTLLVRFFNAHAASDSLIYALDRRAPPAPAGPDGHVLSGAAAGAFRELPQWEPLSAVTGRDTLVTQFGARQSPPGRSGTAPRVVGFHAQRQGAAQGGADPAEEPAAARADVADRLRDVTLPWTSSEGKGDRHRHRRIVRRGAAVRDQQSAWGFGLCAGGGIPVLCVLRAMSVLHHFVRGGRALSHCQEYGIA